MSARDDREDAAWSRPEGADFVLVPPPPSAASQPVSAGGPPPGSSPIVRPGHPDHPDAPSGLITERHDVRPAGRPWRRDAVALGDFSHAGDAPPPRSPRLAWFLGGAGVLVVVGLVVVLVMSISGAFGSGTKLPFTSSDSANGGPPLAQACPPPTATGNPGYKEGPTPPPGPRTVDDKAGISYSKYGSPWQPWADDWSAGQLHVHWRVGQGFITEEYAGGTYWASILSAAVPATVNDGTTLDLKCVGQQIVADVRGTGTKNPGFYPQPNTMTKIEDKLTTVGGLPAYVSIFRMHFDDSAEGLKSRSELVGVATFDVGKPTAAVLYVSIPQTAHKYDYVVRDAINSVRVAK
jgi:hypothetical protein